MWSLRAAALACVLAVTSVAYGAPDRSAIEGGPNQVAHRVLAAQRKGDASLIAALAKERSADPWLVANVLLMDAIGESPLSASPEAWDALAAFANAAAERPEAERLPAIVQKWKSASSDERDRERRLIRAQVRIQLARPPATGATLFDGAKKDFEDCPDSVTAIVAAIGGARAYAHAGRIPEDEDLLDKAADRAIALGWGLGAAEAWSAASMRASGRGEHAKALRYEGRALETFQALGDRRRAAVMRANRAVELVQSGRPQEALAEADHARAAASAIGAQDAMAQADAAAARASRVLGRDEESDALFARTADAFRKMGLKERADAELGSWVQSLVDAGAFAQALDVAGRIFASADPSMNPTTAYGIHGNVAIAYLRLGRFTEALVEAKLALESAKATGYPLNLPRAHLLLAGVLNALGRSQEAAAELKELDGFAWKAGDAELRLDVLSTLAAQAIDRDRPADAIPMLREAHTLAEESGNPITVASVEIELARALEATGDLGGAVTELDRAVNRIEAAGRRFPEQVTARRRRAALLLRLNRGDDALVDLRYALELSRALGRRLADADVIGLRTAAREIADVGVLAALACPSDDPVRRETAARAAFDFIEESRGARLSEGLANAKGILAARLPPELVQEDLLTRAALEAAQARALRPSTEGLRSGAESASAAVESAWRRRDETWGRIQRAARSVVALATPLPPDFDAVSDALQDDEAIVLWHMTPTKAAAVVVRHGAVRLVPLGDSADLLRASEAFLRLASAPGSDDVPAATAAYDAILRPLEPALAGAKRWILVPDRILAFVPIDALVRRDGERATRVVERAECVYAPSAAVHQALSAEAKPWPREGRILAVGDPTPPAGGASGFGALPESREEAVAVAAYVPEPRRIVLLGEDATPARVLSGFASEGPRFAVVHFACHGVVDVRRVGGTGLVLAGGQILDADRLARTQVPAELAVLSACESGRGAEVMGEGVFGLARAFFLGGVPRVVVSEWAVSDAATRTLMTRFVASAASGKTASAALRDSKLEALRAGGSGAHPSKWAAFVLWGTDR